MLKSLALPHLISISFQSQHGYGLVREFQVHPNWSVDALPLVRAGEEP